MVEFVALAIAGPSVAERAAGIGGALPEPFSRSFHV
jgi:hypothetical protein